MKALLVLFGVVLSAGAGVAESFTEDFESFSLEGFFPTEKPSQDWYTYREGDDIGNVTNSEPVIAGSQSFRVAADNVGTSIDNFAQFSLVQPGQLSSFNFTIQAEPPDNVTAGTMQVVSISSLGPARQVVEFYIFCRDTVDTDGCEFRVRFEQFNTTGVVLINETLGVTRFAVRMEFSWTDLEYRLFVNGVDDGLFPFLEVPPNVGKIRISQFRPDFRMNATLDDWTISGAAPVPDALTGDAATGLRTFASDIRLTTTGSLFLFGAILLVIMVAALFVPMVSVGLDNTIVPALSFFAVLTALWLIDMEFWPGWVGIAGIIAAAALVASLVRQGVMGMSNVSTSASVVGASLGYFIIATTLLAFSGYATDEIQIPVTPPEPDDAMGQSFTGAVVECTLGIVTFGFLGDCSQETTNENFASFTDALGAIAAWARAGLSFVFQLLTFQLPVPVIFNMAIVFPPAVSLATYGIEVIRG